MSLRLEHWFQTNYFQAMRRKQYEPPPAAAPHSSPAGSLPRSRNGAIEAASPFISRPQPCQSPSNSRRASLAASLECRASLHELLLLAFLLHSQAVAWKRFLRLHDIPPKLISATKDRQPAGCHGDLPNIMRQLVVGIDYGTSHSGVAYSLFDDKDSIAVGEVEISVIKDLDQSNAGGGASDKIPSDTAYGEHGELVGQGFEIPEGVQPLQWVKLLLEPNGFKGKTANDVKMWKCYRDLREKKPVDVVTDYLKWLWERTKYCVIDKVDEDDIFENKDVHLTVVLTVPASWSERAKQCVQKAAMMAGIPELAIKLVPEPEAAAIFGLKSQAQKKTIEKGDCVIVCDAGGGTVDLVAYRVLRRHPLQIDQITASDGSFCGSAFIDTEFQNQLKSILGAKYDHLDDAAKAAIEHEFEFKIKRTYNPDKLPQKRHFIPMPLEDDPDRHIENGKMRIDEAVLKEAFGSIMTDIMRLIDKQVEELVSKDYGDKIKGILLVGGLSKSEYLRNRLKQEFPGKEDMKIWRADDPWTAVAKGAVACETSKVVHARLSPYNFGIPYLDEGDKKVHWLVRKGQSVKSNMPTQPYALRVDDEPWLDQDEYCHILVNLVRSDEDDAEDGYGPLVVPHAEIDCRVPTKLRHSKDARPIRKQGKRAWHIPATLVLFLDGAVISFQCRIKDEEVGLAEVRYFHDEADLNNQVEALRRGSQALSISSMPSSPTKQHSPRTDSKVELEAVQRTGTSTTTNSSGSRGSKASITRKWSTPLANTDLAAIFQVRTKRDASPGHRPREGALPGMYARGWIPKEDYYTIKR